MFLDCLLNNIDHWKYFWLTLPRSCCKKLKILIRKSVIENGLNYESFNFFCLISPKYFIDLKIYSNKNNYTLIIIFYNKTYRTRVHSLFHSTNRRRVSLFALSYCNFAILNNSELFLCSIVWCSISLCNGYSTTRCL